MDFRLSEASLSEALDSERDSDEVLIGLQCAGCGYEMWVHVRPKVPTEIKCFRSGCGTQTTINLSL